MKGMPMIGNLRTKNKIHASRTVGGDEVEIPGGSILKNVRTADTGSSLPSALENYIRTSHNVNFHVFDYDGETLFMPFHRGLLAMTEKMDSESK